MLAQMYPEGYIGCCVEVGAYNGTSGSNTYYFERERGWNCVCVEPNPKQYEICKNVRKCAIQACVGEKDASDVPFYIYKIGDNGLNESAISGLEPDSRLINSHMHLIKDTEQILVKVRTLTDILDSVNFPRTIDYISIDTENTELSVLKGFDLNKYNVSIFVIENNYAESMCEDYLKNFGYKKFHRLGVNDFFKKETGDKPASQLVYNSYHGEIQNGKEVDKVLREYFPDPAYKGIFLDIGAYEPINISNSYHFEQNGWNVICFEANTNLIPELSKYRKNVYNYAISNEPKEMIEFNVVHGVWGGGSLTAGVSAINLDPQYMERFSGGIRAIERICVEQVSLNSCLDNILNNVKDIDIVSIDVEGGELNVLKGFDLSTYKVKVFVIENVFNNSKITEYLSNYNYILDKKIEYNEYYIMKK